MTRNLRAALEQKRSELLRQVGDRIIGNPDADIRDDVSRIEALEVLLKTLPSPIRKRLWVPLIIALGCLAAVSSAWSLKVDALGFRTSVLLTADTGTVSLTTNRDWELSDPIRPKGRQLRIEEMDEIAISHPDPSQVFSSIADARRLYVEGPYYSLHQLNLKEGTELTLETADTDQVAANVHGAEASGGILINGSVQLEWQREGGLKQRAELVLEIPEEITFSVTHREAVPGSIVFKRGTPFILRDLGVSSLGFGREVTGAPGAFVSTIESGHLRLPGVDGSHQLFAGDRVQLSGVEGRVRRITVGDLITVDFEGTVKRVSVGPSGEERDITPSVLSYVYYNQPLAFLFTAASFLWGVLWSLRRLIGA